jgi:GT2 family glycosyltransferase
MTIALGITTYNRPAFADKCVRAIRDHVAPLCSSVFLYNDGSDPKYRAEYQRAYKRMPEMIVQDPAMNSGVSIAKNAPIGAMLTQTDADWLFICEDDIKVLSPKAITEYVRVAEQANFHHLSFAHHGPANSGGPVANSGDVAYYPHSIGAWSCFSRQALETVGLYDENFCNAWEHVEHELRLIQAGLMPGADIHKFPDVIGSEAWLQELPGSIDKSSIRPRDDWHSNIRNGLLYWRDAKPDTYDMLFGTGKPLAAYARQVTG